MLDLVKTLVGKQTTEFLAEVRKIVDEIFTTKEELKSLENEKEQIAARIEEKLLEYQSHVVDAIIDEQKEITLRHRYDMMSDSWLSKNIRPLALIVLFGLFLLFSLLDGFKVFGFSSPPDLIQLLGTWGTVVMSFYFGGRSVEKAIKIFRNPKDVAPGTE